MLEITQEEIKRLKGLGFLFNNDKEHFSARVITENGVMSGEQMRLVAEAAERFGNGNAALTTRLTMEVMGITYENVEPFKAFIENGSMVIGGTGAKVRPVVACKGTVCVYGFCDTQGVATKIHKRFYEGYSSVVLPHKFKIAVGGCPNNCVKPDLNDIGIAGRRKDGKSAFQIYIGGRWGKKTRKGDTLDGLFSEEEALDIIEKAILLFKEKGTAGERFGAMIDRIGFEEIQKCLLQGQYLLPKSKKFI